MIRSLINFMVLIGFTLLLPLFCIAAWGWGSEDERLLMKIAFCVLAPFCADLWYILLSHLVFRHRSSYLMQALIIIGGYGGIALLLKEGVIAF